MGLAEGLEFCWIALSFDRTDSTVLAEGRKAYPILRYEAGDAHWKHARLEVSITVLSVTERSSFQETGPWPSPRSKFGTMNKMDF
jgi:hypothetical protein